MRWFLIAVGVLIALTGLAALSLRTTSGITTDAPATEYPADWDLLQIGMTKDTIRGVLNLPEIAGIEENIANCILAQHADGYEWTLNLCFNDAEQLRGYSLVRLDYMDPSFSSRVVYGSVHREAPPTVISEAGREAWVWAKYELGVKFDPRLERDTSWFERTGKDARGRATFLEVS